jgi:hypothetical protein
LDRSHERGAAGEKHGVDAVRVNVRALQEPVHTGFNLLQFVDDPRLEFLARHRCVDVESAIPEVEGSDFGCRQLDFQRL